MLERISVSRAKAYQQCPLYHDAVYNKKMGQKGDHLHFGTIIHKVLELYHKNPNRDIMKIYDEVWVQHPLTDLDFYRDGQRMLSDYISNPVYHQNRIATDSNGELLIEKYFRIPLDEDGQVIASGIIDRIDHIDEETCEVIDYKTSRLPYTKQELETDIQATLYTLATMQKIAPHYKNYKISFFFLRYGKFTTERTAEEIEDFRHFFINLYYQMLFDTEPEPKLNQYCNYCPIRNSGCNLYKNLTRDEKLLLGEFPGKEDEIVKQLEEIKDKERIIRARRSELETSLENILRTRPESGITVGNKHITLTPQSRSSYSYELVERLLGETEAKSLANISKGRVDKMIKGNEELQRLFDEGKTEYFIKPRIDVKEI